MFHRMILFFFHIFRLLFSQGLSSTELMELLKTYRAKAFNPHSGKGFAYVYTMENEKFECIEKAYDMFSGDDEIEGT